MKDLLSWAVVLLTMGAVTFCHSQTQVNSFKQLAELTAGDAKVGDSVGWSVAVSSDGNVAVAGSPDYNSQQGAVYVFVKPSTGWASTSTYAARLTASDGLAFDQFGLSVAISGDTIVVGANANAGTGAAYVYVKPSGGWKSTSIFTAKLTAFDLAISEKFGSSVAISGKTIVVGTPRKGVGVNGNQGAVYIFTKPSAGWTSTSAFTAELTASDGAPDNQLGKSVAINGTTILTGAPGLVANYTGKQRAYIYVQPAGGWRSTSSFRAELTASTVLSAQSFGYAVALTNTNAVVGSPGGNAAYVYTKPTTGWVTTSAFKAKLTSNDSASGDSFGIGVAIFSTKAMIGASTATVNGNTTEGAVYEYDQPTGGWKTTSVATQKVTPLDGSRSLSFGLSIAMCATARFVGASGISDTGTRSGAVYVF